MPRARASGWSSWLPDVSALLLVPMLLLGAPALAAETPVRRVELIATGADSDVEALRVSLQDWLHPLQLELRRVERWESEEAFARVRVVWSDETCVVEVFTLSGTLARRKSLPRGGPPLLVSESAALVAHAGVQELFLEAKKREPLPTLSAPTMVTAPATETEPKGLGWSLGAFLLGRSYDQQAPFVFGGGAMLSTVWNSESAFRPMASLSISYQGPVTRSSELANLQLQTIGVRLLPGVKWKHDAWSLEAGAGGGIDVLLAAATSGVVPPQLVHGGVFAAPFFSLALGASLQVSTSSSIFLRAGVDFDPARVRFRTAVAGEATTLLEPWGVRPNVQLGFAFDLVSGGAP